MALKGFMFAQEVNQQAEREVGAGQGLRIGKVFLEFRRAGEAEAQRGVLLPKMKWLAPYRLAMPRLARVNMAPSRLAQNRLACASPLPFSVLAVWATRARWHERFVDGWRLQQRPNRFGKRQYRPILDLDTIGSVRPKEASVIARNVIEADTPQGRDGDPLQRERHHRLHARNLPHRLRGGSVNRFSGGRRFLVRIGQRRLELEPCRASANQTIGTRSLFRGCS
jgi:hypothetical protein